MKLMFLGSKMDKLKWSEDSEFKDHDFSTLDSLTKFIICNDPTQECHMGRCQKCGKVENLKNILMQLLDENSIDEITYKRWTHTDRSNLEVIVKSSEDFVESLIQMLQKYMKHNFITKMQSSAYKMAKEDLKEGQMIVVCDFAENYSFVVQDEIQSFHWNNSMVMLHPFVGY